MRFWMDVLTPKQALFFAPLYDLLKREGHHVLVTTRVYREAQQALTFKKIPYSVVGRHGGGDPYSKLVASGQRIVDLASLIHRWGPKVAVSFSSPEASRVAFGLGVPHVSVNDSPHSRYVARLSIPLSAVVCCPWIIGESVWKAFGARRVVKYRALDPAAWLKRHKTDSRVLVSLGLDRHRPIILLRTEEAFASYLMGKASDRAPVVLPVVKELVASKTDAQIVVSTRYGQQAPAVRKAFGRDVVVLEKIVDAASLIAHSSIFIGAGGTMTVESALLGTPAISCFPGEKPLYITYLERRGLVKSLSSPHKIAAIAKSAVNEPEKFEEVRQEGRRLLDWMEDPVAKIHGVLGPWV